MALPLKQQGIKLPFSYFLVPFLAVLLANPTHGVEMIKPVDIRRPQTAPLGESAIIGCRLASWLQMAPGGCTLTHPNGTVININYLTGAVTNNDTEAVIPGYDGVINNNGLDCGLEIESVSEEDLGEWTCHMEHADGPYHEGVFQLLSEGYATDVRLPRHLEALLYVLDIVPFVDNSTFNGKMQMVLTHDGDHQEPEIYRHRVFIHSNGLFVDEDAVTVRYFQTYNTILGFGYDLEREFLIIHVQDELDLIAPSKTFHIVTIDYTASLDQNLVGFYETSYVNEEDETVPVVVTDFEPIDARRAFPCFDEPDRKARFQLAVFHEDGKKVYSNQELKDTQDAPEYGQGWVRDTFYLAEFMSTVMFS